MQAAILSSGWPGPAVEVAPVGTPSQTEVACVGRVMLDVADGTAGGRLNAASALLEGAGGARCSLDLREVDPAAGFSIFPGQIIGVRGMNPSGERFIVREVRRKRGLTRA
jgi:DNA polymerase alpha subunit B